MEKETKELALASKAEVFLPKLGMSLDGLQRIAGLFVASGYYPDSASLAQSCVKMMMGADYGLPPAVSLQAVTIIKGKPSLSATAMAGIIKRYGFNYRIQILNNDRCDIEFFEGGQSIGVSTFTLDDAKQAGLTGNMTYKSYTRNMLFARAMSNGCRWFCSAAFGGASVYSPEELAEELQDDSLVVPFKRTESAEKSTKATKVSWHSGKKEKSEKAANLEATIQTDESPEVEKLPDEVL